jgi:hypothetical protein
MLGNCSPATSHEQSSCHTEMSLKIQDYFAHFADPSCWRFCFKPDIGARLV